jgi:uracil-DNA glycosylase family 4
VTEVERQKALDAIAAEVAVCQRCRLHEGRIRSVPGEGNPATEVVFVGEGPGFNEDRQGRPFVGQAGSLLTELLGSIGWAREDVFITNVVKCRPPGNRDPENEEIAACFDFLKRQLAVLDPALVVTLGRFSMARFNPGARIGQVHGTYRAADPESGAPEALAFAMYHPAAALHQGSLKTTLLRDMAGIPAALMEARSRRESPHQTAPETPATTSPSVAPSASRPATEDPPAVPAPVETRAPADAQLHQLAQATEAVASQAETDPTDQLTLF